MIATSVFPWNGLLYKQKLILFFTNLLDAYIKITFDCFPDAPGPTFTNCPEGETKSFTLTSKTNKAFVDLNIQARDATSQPAVITTIEGPVLDLPGDVEYDEAYRRGQTIKLQASDANGLTAECSFTLKLIGKLTCQCNGHFFAQWPFCSLGKWSLLGAAKADDGGHDRPWPQNNPFSHSPIPRDLHCAPYRHSVTRFIQV